MIQDALALTGNCANVDRSYLMEYDFEGQVVHNTHEWCREGIEPMIAHLQAVPMEGLDDFTGCHQRGEVLLVSRVADLRQGGTLRALLEPQGILTMVAVPLMRGSRCIGFVGFDAVEKVKDWSQGEIELLWVLAEVFVNAKRASEQHKRLLQSVAAAQTAEKRLQSAIQAGEFAIWELNLENNDLLFVCGWNRLSQRDDLDGNVLPLDRFYEMVADHQVPLMKQCVIDSLNSAGAQFQVEYLFRQRSGTMIDALGRWTVERRDGRPERLIGSVENITLFKREQLRLEMKVAVEALVNRVSSRFKDSEGFDSALSSGLRECLMFLEGRWMTLVLLDQDGKALRLAGTVASPGSGAPVDKVFDPPALGPDGGLRASLSLSVAHWQGRCSPRLKTCSVLLRRSLAGRLPETGMRKSCARTRNSIGRSWKIFQRRCY